MEPCEAACQAQLDQMVTEITPEWQAEIAQALHQAWAAASKHELKVKERTVHIKLASLRTGAQPGSSMCRNDVLVAMSAAQGGAKCLRDSSVLGRWGTAAFCC